MAWPEWTSSYGLMIAPNDNRDGSLIAFVQNMYNQGEPRLNIDCIDSRRCPDKPFRYIAYLTELSAHEWSPFTVGLGVKPPPKTVWDRLAEDDE